MSSGTTAALAAALKEKLDNRTSLLGIVGMGYVGLPLAVAANAKGFKVVGFDIDEEKVRTINSGVSPINSIPSANVEGMIKSGGFHTTVDFDKLSEVDAILICVPTPLTRYRDPDLSFIERTGEAIVSRLKKGQLVVLESSSYPGTTTGVLQPILESSGLKAGVDFFIGYAPEREDPGNPDFHAAIIPRVCGGDDPSSAMLTAAVYTGIVGKVVPVSSCATAEAVKITENTFRAVNIALVNELKLIYRKMGIDIWEVIEAAKSKPFGFMAFYPGPGIGGHCIPIDPFYLTWKAREFNVATRFIELAGEVNAEAPRQVVMALTEAMNMKLQKSVNGSRILLLGMAYKKNIDDMRESPSLKLLEMLEAQGAKVEYYDPMIPVIPPTREHAELAGRRRIIWNKETVSGFDVALIATDHDDVDYESLVAWSKLVIDTRNVTASVKDRSKVVAA